MRTDTTPAAMSQTAALMKNGSPEMASSSASAGASAGLRIVARTIQNAETQNRDCVCHTSASTKSRRTVGVVWPPTRKTVQNGW